MSSTLPAPTTQKNNVPLPADNLRIQRVLEMSRDSDMPDEMPALTTLASKSWRKRLLKVPRRTLVLIGGAVALVFVALMIGLLIGSLNKPAPAPWQSSPTYERMYLTMIADKYARTGDAFQAERDLSGASREDILRTLEAMQKETSDSQKRTRLTALADIMRPPVTQTSFMPMLVAQPVFLLSLLLSFTPMLAAIGLLVVPYIREQLAKIDTETGEVELDASGLAVIDPENVPSDLKVDEPVTGAPPEQVVEPKPEEAPTEEEKKKQEEEEEEEEQNQQDNGMGDLASLFEEEDTSLAVLENFCKGLSDINMDVLLANAKNTAQSLKDSIAQRS